MWRFKGHSETLKGPFASRWNSWEGGALFCFGKIGDLEGHGRPGDVVATHSLKWPPGELGAAAFKVVNPPTPYPAGGSARNTSRPEHPIGRAK